MQPEPFLPNATARRLATLLWMGLLATAVPALGQEDEEKLYAVEVVVFRHSSTPEPAYRPPGEPAIDGALDLVVPLVEDAIPDYPAEPEPPKRIPNYTPPWAQAEPDSDAGPFVFEDSSVFRPPVDQDQPLEPEEEMGPPAPRILPIDPNSTPAPLLHPEAPSPFQPLAQEDLQLTAAWRRLTRHPNYTPLVHLGWRQPASPFGEPTPIRVHGGRVLVQSERPELFSVLDPVEDEAPIEEVDGTVALERGRFLHLRVDLVLRDLLNPSIRGNDPTPLRAEIPMEEELPYRNHRLTERRQIQRQSVNYFDHREFGMIAVVTEWIPPEEPEIDPDADPADPLAEGPSGGPSTGSDR